MTKEDPFAELAGICCEICHVLETVDDLGGFNDHIEDFGRCAGLACPFSSIIIIGLRILTNIEPAVRERADCSTDAQEHLYMSSEECVNAWQKDLGEILSFFEVRRRRITAIAQHLTRHTRESQSEAVRLSVARLWNSPLIRNQT